MSITYPTLNLIDSYLQSYYKNLSITLSSGLPVLGNTIGSGNMFYLPGANVSGQAITGIDIPILVDNPNCNDTIMIIEQDPLRNLKQFQPYYGNRLQTGAIVGTPNALHQNPVQLYLNIVSGLIKKGYNVYLTDTYKIYAPGLKTMKGRWTNLEKQLLVDEIKCINPFKILCLGKMAQNAYSHIQQHYPNIKPIFVPHPSARANVWNQHINPSTNNMKIQYILNLIP